jgi:hypothetical protein
MVAALAANMGPLTRLLRSYDAQLQRRPLLVNMATSASLWAVGDLVSQRVQGAGTPQHARGGGSLQRIAYTGAFGGLVFGPLGHAWYTWLDRVAGAFGAPGTMGVVFAKVLADNAIWTSAYVGEGASAWQGMARNSKNGQRNICTVRRWQQMQPAHAAHVRPRGKGSTNVANANTKDDVFF